MNDFVWIDVEADGFLYNMVRSITGTLVLGRHGPLARVAGRRGTRRRGPPRGRADRAAAGAVPGPGPLSHDE